MTNPDRRSLLAPLHVFRFNVSFFTDAIASDGELGSAVPLCQGAFSECSGLEATMEPREIEEGGRNYGTLQRMGRVTFGTVILKRGLTTNRDLWGWWRLVNQGAYAARLAAVIDVLPPPGGEGAPQPAWSWVLRRCLPVKFKAPDLNATSGDVGIEELHLAHEGLMLKDAGGSQPGSGAPR